MQTRVVKSTLLPKHKTVNRCQTKIKMSSVTRERVTCSVSFLVKPQDLLVLNKWKLCTQSTILLCTLY